MGNIVTKFHIIIIVCFTRPRHVQARVAAMALKELPHRHRLFVWLVGWLVGWFVGWLVGCFEDIRRFN